MIPEWVRGVRNEKGCWYHRAVDFCPVCCSERVYITRRPPPAPPKHERYEQVEAYDWCDAL